MSTAPTEPYMPHLKLEQLHDVSGEDIEFEEQLFDIFKEQFEISRGKLEAALKASDKTNIVLYSHDIKGAARNIGAEEVGRVAKEMEENARAAAFKEVSDALPALNDAFKKLIELFEEYLASHKKK